MTSAQSITSTHAAPAPPTSTSSGASAPGGGLRRQLRGMSYDEGTATLAPGPVQRTAAAGAAQPTGVRRVSLSGCKSVLTGQATALVPAGLDPSQPVDVLLHLHGHGGPQDASVHQLDKQLKDTGMAQMIGMLPQGSAKSDFSPGGTGSSGGSKAFDTNAFIDEVLQKLAGGTLAAKPKQLGRVVMSAHSGGGDALGQVLDGGKAPTDLGMVLLFDAINPPAKDELPRIQRWLESRIAADVAALAMKPDPKAQVAFLRTSPRFHAYYSLAPDPKSAVSEPPNCYEAVHRKLATWLQAKLAALAGGVSGDAKAMLTENYKVISTGVKQSFDVHNKIVGAGAVKGQGKVTEELKSLIGPGDKPDAKEPKKEPAKDAKEAKNDADKSPPKDPKDPKGTKPKDAGLDAFRVPLIAGKLVDKGEYLPPPWDDVGLGLFPQSAELDAALEYFCTVKWPQIGKDGGKSKKPAKPPTGGGGDSAGADAAGLAPWFNAIQEILVNVQKKVWGEDEDAARALLEAYLRGRTAKAPGAVKEFYKHVGKSEVNEKSADHAGKAGTDNWCQGAATLAVIRGMRAAGLRFKARAAPRALQGGPPAGSMVKVDRQDLLFTYWLSDGPAKLGKPLSGEPPPRHQIAEPAAHDYALKPGDIISILTKEAPVSGHVAMVVAFDAPTIRMVSGNAGTKETKKGSIRVEEIRRDIPKAKRVWQYDQPKNPGVNVPAKTGVAWIVCVQTTSQLDPEALGHYPAEDLAKMQIERF